MKRVAAALLVTTVLAACAQSDGPMSPAEFDPAFSKGAAKVVICHLNDEGGYNKIEVGAAAAASHMAHGDGLPGSGQLSADCTPVLITLDYSDTFDTGTGGGGGGGAFRDVCPAGSVGVGIAGTRGSYYGWAAISTHRIDCRALLTDGTLGAGASTPARGGWFMTPFAGTCPADGVLVGGSGTASWVVVSIGGSCASVADILAAGAPTATVGPFAGSGVGGGGFNLPCGPGYAVTGTYGGAGDVLDRVGFICTRIVKS